MQTRTFRSKKRIPAVQLEQFNDSLETCLADRRFLPRFYELFLASSPEVREKFAATDFRRQNRALRASLMLLVFAVQDVPEGRVHLERIAALHGPEGLAIPDRHYDLWLEALLQAASEHDRGFTPEVREAWIAVLTPGIEHLRSARGQAE